jgi:hypothetical protein
MENVGIFYGHLVYFWPLRKIVVIWYTFSPFWYIVSRKIWQPWPRSRVVMGFQLGVNALPEDFERPTLKKGDLIGRFSPIG